MLNPDATNCVTCSKCGWTRILDPLRAYRGGHTHPETGAECHEMLIHTQLDARRPEVAVLELEPRLAPGELSQIAAPLEGDRADEGMQRLEAAVAHNETVEAKVADLYSLRGEELEQVIDRVRRTDA